MSTIYYPSKILLFGEYTVTHGSGALAIPYFGHSGHWKSDKNHFDESLINLCSHLRKTSSSHIDVEKFYEDVQQGLTFDSTIPQGYGLGSSGALVAAIYDQYKYAEITDLSLLKEVLAAMESYFHGKSSGIDPLVSYLKEPIFITGSGIHKTRIPSAHSMQIFLLDSLTPRNTEDWVNHFQQKKQSSSSFQESVNALTRINEEIMSAYLAGDDETFWSLGQRLSQHQFDHFREFIPANHQNVWENSLGNPSFFLKICGAGGGGYTLGFAARMDEVLREIKEYQPTWIY